MDARNFEWGDPSEPLDDSDDQDTNYQLGFIYHNPGGLGDPVSDDVLYAPWTGLQRMVNLTLRVSQCDIGGTWPMVGTHLVPYGTPVTIVAVPVTGASFDGWAVVSGTGHLTDPNSQDTAVTLLDDCVVEATLSGQATCFNEGFDTWATGHGLTPEAGGFFNPQRDSSGNGIADVTHLPWGWIQTPLKL